MVSTPAEFQAWRAETDATQEMVAEVLGVSSRAVASWAVGEHPMPSLLPWALVAARPHVESLVRQKRRKMETARRRAAKRKQQRRTAATRAAKRAVMLEAMRERRAEVEAQRKLVRKQTSDTLRAGERFIKKMEREGKIRAPGSSFLKPPRERIVRPRKIRSDVGQPHRFRGRPGYPLRPEDIQHEE